MLTIRVAGMMTRIDQEILYKGVKYSVFAVGYRGFLHFISWIRLQNEIFEYDGNNKCGLLIRVGDNVELFTNEIIDQKNRLMKAVVVWYTRS